MSKADIVGPDARSKTDHREFSITTEDFYIPADNLETNEFDVAQESSFADDLKRASKMFEEHKAESIEIERKETQPAEEPKKEKKVSVELQADFFDQPVPDDHEKIKVVEEISGMEAISESVTEPGVAVAVQFKETGDDEESIAIEMQPQQAFELPGETPLMGVKSDTAMKKRGSSITKVGSKITARKSSADEIRVSTISKFGDPERMDSYLGRASIRPKESISMAPAKRRDTKSYSELGPRIRGLSEEDDDLIGFDMSVDVPVIFDDEVEEEEVQIIKEEEVMPVLDRKPYYERHDEASEEVMIKKMKNCILQKLLAMYFKRKKMDYVTKETEWSFDQQNKYTRKLEGYGELVEFDNMERIRTNAEIEATKKERENKLKDLTNMFKKMQNREREIGYGLINSKTGNVLPDKHLDRLINRQFMQMEQVRSMRLTYIRLKQMVQEKLDGIASLDEVAPGFLLVNYEQLKIMNQSYADKIEEKDEELTRLRTKCASTIQILAHFREKSVAFDNDLGDLEEDLHETGFIFNEVRAKLNYVKQQRDAYRHSLNKMRDESGLLTQPTLLRDMEQGLTDVEELSAHLKFVIREHKKRANQIKIIRKKIEQAVEMRRYPRKSTSRLRASMFRLGYDHTKPTIYKGRPSMMMPNIEDSAFDSLKSIKPKITYDRRRYDPNIKHSKKTG